MQQEILYYLFTTAVTVVIGIIGYFLKRTMNRSDQNEIAIRGLRDDLLTLSDRYATKEEIREIKDSMEKLTASIDYIKEHATRNDDFVRTMTRLETKIDKLKG